MERDFHHKTIRFFDLNRKVLRHLLDSSGGDIPPTFQDIADAIGIDPSAAWKHVDYLRSIGPCPIMKFGAGRPPVTQTENGRKLHDYVWDRHRRGIVPYRDDMARDLKIPIYTVAHIIRVLRREGRYPDLPVRNPRSNPRSDQFRRKNEEVFQYLAECAREGYTPTNQEIADRFGIGRSAAHYHVKRLRQLGKCPPVNPHPGNIRRLNFRNSEIPVSPAEIEAAKAEIRRENARNRT